MMWAFLLLGNRLFYDLLLSLLLSQSVSVKAILERRPKNKIRPTFKMSTNHHKRNYEGLTTGRS